MIFLSLIYQEMHSLGKINIFKLKANFFSKISDFHFLINKLPLIFYQRYSFCIYVFITFVKSSCIINFIDIKFLKN